MSKIRYCIYIIGIAAVLLPSVLVSCMDEKFSSDPSHTLAFSTDTVSFDTLFTGIGSATRLLKVYNRHDKSLMFSVQLADKANSGFRVNVDGRTDVGVTRFDGLSVRGGDSLYIFIELTAAARNSADIGMIKDSLLFVTNGTRQDVKLIAYGRDATTLHAPVVSRDTTFTAHRPIIIHDSLVVAEGATLTCEAGTSLYFHDKAGVIVRGRLVVQGEPGREVVLRGDRTDRLFPYLPYDRVPGQWGGVTFTTGSYGNELLHADIHGGLYAVRCDSSDVTRDKVRIVGCKLTNTTGNVLEMTDCRADIANTELSNAGLSCVDLTGGDVRFTHCTLANYFSYGIKHGAALSLRNTVGDVQHPVIEAAFVNCIIAGSSRDEISGGVSDDESTPYNYRFHNSLINSVEPDDGDIDGCRWEKDDHFRLIDGDNYIYDFTLDSLSAARDMGSPAAAADYPLDRLGRPRSSAMGGDGMPDAGCYEWMPDGWQSRQ